MRDIPIQLNILSKFLLHINKGEKISIHLSMATVDCLHMFSENKMCIYNTKDCKIDFITDSWGLLVKAYINNPGMFADFYSKFGEL